MAGMVKVIGVPRVLAKLKAASVVAGVSIGTRLKLAGLFVQRESQKIVPILTANLKGSANTRNVGGEGFDTDIVVSYSTEYAVYVHEDLDARHKPGKQAKFLESVVRTKRKEILKIIAGKKI